MTDLLVGKQLLPRASEDDPAGLQDECAVGQGQSVLGVLFHQEHRDACPIDGADHPEHLGNHDGQAFLDRRHIAAIDVQPHEHDDLAPTLLELQLRESKRPAPQVQ